MWKAFRDRVAYTAMTVLVFAGGLALRYVGHWAPNPVDPTRNQDIFLGAADHVLSTSPAVLRRDEQHTVWEVAFVTQHSFDETTGDFDGPGSEPHFGLTEVSLPKWRLRGSLPLEGKDEPQQADIVTRSGDRELQPEQFYEALQARLATAEQRDVLVFVHGFNVSFHESVCRIAQMAEDMPFSGVVLAYDWNSRGSDLGYFHDKWTTGTTHSDFARLLAELRERLDADVRIHVLAHSMGNRFLLNALQSLATYEPYLGANASLSLRSTTGAEAPVPSGALVQPVYAGWQRWHPRGTDPKPLANVIFAAPDVHPEVFQKSLGQLIPISDQLTLYCNEADFALELSRYINGQGKRGYRVGDARAGLSTAAVDIIRLEHVSAADPFGHSYYGSHPGLLTDLALLLNERRTLQHRPTVTAGHWPHQDEWYLR